MNFNPDDVRAVAQALLQCPLYEDCSGRNAYQYCKYCKGSRYANGDDDLSLPFPHKLDCVTLIAQDLLTERKSK